MTKLEEKLLELGYKEEWTYDNIAFYIKCEIDYETHIFLKNQKIVKSKINVKKHIEEQYQIDNLQQAFNQLQKDLEVLKDENNN